MNFTTFENETDPILPANNTGIIDWYLMINTSKIMNRTELNDLRNLEMIPTIINGIFLFCMVLLFLSKFTTSQMKKIMYFISDEEKQTVDGVCEKKSTPIPIIDYKNKPSWSIQNQIQEKTRSRFLSHDHLFIYLTILIFGVHLLIETLCGASLILTYEFAGLDFFLVKFTYGFIFLTFSSHLVVSFTVLKLWFHYGNVLYVHWRKKVKKFEEKCFGKEAIFDRILEMQHYPEKKETRFKRKIIWILMFFFSCSCILFLWIGSSIVRWLVSEDVMFFVQNFGTIPLFAIYTNGFQIFTIYLITRHVQLVNSCKVKMDQIKKRYEKKFAQSAKQKMWRLPPLPSDSYSSGDYKRAIFILVSLQLSLFIRMVGVCAIEFGAVHFIQWLICRVLPMTLPSLTIIIFTLPCCLFCKCRLRSSEIEFTQESQI